MVPMPMPFICRERQSELTQGSHCAGGHPAGAPRKDYRDLGHHRIPAIST